VRYSRARKAETRQRLIDAALRAFRDKGFEATGISTLMAGIGLTHGGFYAHFASKAALIAEAADRGMAARTAGLRALAAAQPAPARAALLIDRYLSDAHLQNRADGCVLAALAADIARESPLVRRRFTRRFRELADVVARDITGGLAKDADLGPDDRRARALVLLAGLVGTLILARAVDDPRLRRAMRDSMKHGLQRLLQAPTTLLPRGAASAKPAAGSARRARV